MDARVGPVGHERARIGFDRFERRYELGVVGERQHRPLPQVADLHETLPPLLDHRLHPVGDRLPDIGVPRDRDVELSRSG
jgi:hypothetical protein